MAQLLPVLPLPAKDLWFAPQHAFSEQARGRAGFLRLRWEMMHFLTTGKETDENILICGLKRISYFLSIEAWCLHEERKMHLLHPFKSRDLGNSVSDRSWLPSASLWTRGRLSCQHIYTHAHHAHHVNKLQLFQAHSSVKEVTILAELTTVTHSPARIHLYAPSCFVCADVQNQVCLLQGKCSSALIL